MEKFDSVFRRKNKTYIVLSIIYLLVSLALITTIIIINQVSFRDIAFALLAIFMLLRYLLFVFEQTTVDTEKREVRLKIQRKIFRIDDIVSIKKQPRRSMVKGQMRITNAKGSSYPIYVDDEDKFLALLLSMNSNIEVS